MLCMTSPMATFIQLVVLSHRSITPKELVIPSHVRAVIVTSTPRTVRLAWIVIFQVPAGRSASARVYVFPGGSHSRYRLLAVV